MDSWNLALNHFLSTKTFQLPITPFALATWPIVATLTWCPCIGRIGALVV